MAILENRPKKLLLGLLCDGLLTHSKRSALSEIIN